VQSSSQITTTNKPTSSFLQAGCTSCRPTNSVEALKGKISHSKDLFTPSSPGGLPTLSLTTRLKAPGYLGGGLPCPLQPVLSSSSCICSNEAQYIQLTNPECKTRAATVFHSFLHCIFIL